MDCQELTVMHDLRSILQADLAAAAPGRDLVNSHAPLIRDNAAVFAVVRGSSVVSSTIGRFG